MQKSLDDLLGALSISDPGAPSANLETGVWSRIEAEDLARRASPSLGIHIAVALTTLVIGLSVGWSATTTDHPTLSSILSDDYAQYGPLARLSNGL
jgi:hypothetical protein